MASNCPSLRTVSATLGTWFFSPYVPSSVAKTSLKWWSLLSLSSQSLNKSSLDVLAPVINVTSRPLRWTRKEIKGTSPVPPPTTSSLWWCPTPNGWPYGPLTQNLSPTFFSQSAVLTGPPFLITTPASVFP